HDLRKAVHLSVGVLEGRQGRIRARGVVRLQRSGANTIDHTARAASVSLMNFFGMHTSRHLTLAIIGAGLLTGASRLVVVDTLAQGGRAGGQAPAANAPLPNDISGFWELR